MLISMQKSFQFCIPGLETGNAILEHNVDIKQSLLDIQSQMIFGLTSPMSKNTFLSIWNFNRCEN